MVRAPLSFRRPLRIECVPDFAGPHSKARGSTLFRSPTSTVMWLLPRCTRSLLPWAMSASLSRLSSSCPACLRQPVGGKSGKSGKRLGQLGQLGPRAGPGSRRALFSCALESFKRPASSDITVNASRLATCLTARSTFRTPLSEVSEGRHAARDGEDLRDVIIPTGNGKYLEAIQPFESQRTSGAQLWQPPPAMPELEIAIWQLDRLHRRQVIGELRLPSRRPLAWECFGWKPCLRRGPPLQGANTPLKCEMLTVASARTQLAEKE